MLLNKKVFYLFNFINYPSSTLNLNITYILLKKQLLINYMVLLESYFFIKKKLKISYFYIIKIKIPNWVIFNSILFFLFKILYYFNKNIKLTFNFKKKKNIRYTVLRSPFKYKTSREYFGFYFFLGSISLMITEVDFFILSYLEFYFYKILSNLLSYTIVLNKIIYILL